MEINASHPIVAELRKRADADKSDKTVRDLVWLLFETALLTSGFNLEDPTSFASRIHRMIKLGISIEDSSSSSSSSSSSNATDKTDDMPPLETDVPTETVSNMEEVD